MSNSRGRRTIRREVERQLQRALIGEAPASTFDSEPIARRKSGKTKPIDLWFFLASAVIAVILFLAPKTPLIAFSCLLGLFLLLVHPLWNFWWIEDARWRQIAALFICAAGIVSLGAFTVENDVFHNMTIQANPISGESDPFQTMFTIRNGGGFPVSWYNIHCRISSLAFEAITVTTDKPPGGFEYYENNPSTAELDASGGSESVPCLSTFPRPSANFPFHCGDVVVIVEYKIMWVPITRTKQVRLVTVKRDKEFEWIEKNIHDQHLYCYQ